mmetsp:Transcript_52220/g.124498  ORF Transcript_52220/g.124498 Transcript_52220/m.124498 type:complete len:561 (-) Transcript_52220:100-1782(-)
MGHSRLLFLVCVLLSPYAAPPAAAAGHAVEKPFDAPGGQQLSCREVHDEDASAAECEVGLLQTDLSKFRASQRAIPAASDTSLRLAGVILLGFLCMAVPFWWLWVTAPSHAGCVKWQLQVLGYFDVLIQIASASSVAPISLEVSRSFGHGAVFSGFIISAMFMFSALGSLLGRLLVTRADYGTLRILQLLFLGLCSLAFLASGLLVHHTESSWPPHKDAFFIAARALSGFLIFAWNNPLWKIIIDVLQTPLRVRQGLLQSLAMMAGSGIGPVVVAVITYKSEASDAAAFAAAGCFYVFAAYYLFHTLFFWLVVPRTADGMREAAADEWGMDLIQGADGNDSVFRDSLSPPGKMREDEAWWRTLAYCFGHLYGVERAVVSVALEAATSYILETRFGWAPSRVALWVGIIYLLGLIVAYSANLLKGQLSELNLMKVCSFLGGAASILLAIFIEKADFVVLSADFVLFTSCFVAGGTAMGMSTAVAMPESRWFNIENALFFRIAFIGNVGKFLAPLLVRGTLERSTLAYGVLQVSMTSAGVMLCHGLEMSAKELQVGSKSADG